MSDTLPAKAYLKGRNDEEMELSLCLTKYVTIYCSVCNQFQRKCAAVKNVLQ